MTCTEAREQILIADVTELRPGGESPFASHLAGCAACRALASAIVAETAALGRLLPERVPTGRRRASRTIAWIAAVGAPIAAAAVWAIALRGREQPMPPVTHADRPAPAKHVSVDVAVGQHATVMKTADPNVTLIWLSPGAGQ